MRHFRNAAGIYIPKFREIETSALCVGLSGHITVDVIHARTGIIKQHLEMKNLITDAGLNAIAGARPLDLFVWCAVGTGNTAPANTDLGLVSEISTRTSDNSGINDVLGYVSGTPDYHKVVRVRQFSQAQANGNLTEVGFFSASAGGTMFSRQLFKDGTGTPTTVVKTSSDFLRITYEVRVYPPFTDVVQNNVNISGSLYTVTQRPVSVGTDWNTWFNGSSNPNGMIVDNFQVLQSSALVSRTTDGPSGGTIPTSLSVAAYVAGNFYLDCTSVWNTSVANFNILSWYFNNNIRGTVFGIGFNPAIPKDNTKQLTLNFRYSWGRQP